MPHYYPPKRSVTPTSPSSYTNYYPGINPFESTTPPNADTSSITSLTPSPSGNSANSFSTAAEAEVITGSSKSTGGLSIPNLNDIKGIVDRLGGIDGILATVGKVQKIMQTVQQFAPMAKLVTGLLPGSKGQKLQSGGSNLDEYTPPRRSRKKGNSKKGARRSRSQKASSNNKGARGSFRNSTSPNRSLTVKRRR